MILANTIKKASKVLKKYSISTHELDAQIILSDIMGIKRETLITNDQINISKDILKKYNFAIKRRTKREPVAYITGKKEFWSTNFEVNRSTLVPRPETEILIYKIVDLLKNKKVNILDIGTGSGCVLLSVLKELKFSTGTGIDISKKAIKTAKKNAINLNLFSRSKFKTLDFQKYYNSKFDLIVSNPPYIPTKDIKNLSKDVICYEPRIALDGGVDGLDLLKKVIYKSNHLLKSNGLLALEIGFGQYKKVACLLKSQNYREKIRQYDNNHNVRCIISAKL